jgi:hypothetical protein
MTDDTQEFTKPETVKESRIFGVSTRGIITLLIVLTVCGMSAAGRSVEEPLYTMVGLVIGFYFGQREKPKSQN